MLPDDISMDIVVPADLAPNWSDAEPPETLREIGRDWLERRASVAMKVPSAIVTEEWNYLLNPQHVDFARLSFGRPEAFRFDYRLARMRRR